MGCKPTKEGEGTRSSNGGGDGVPASSTDNGKPQVPEDSWYAADFTEQPTTDVSNVLNDARGMVLFGTVAFPVKDSGIDPFIRQTASHALTKDHFTLGSEDIFALAIPFATALNIEHAWRLRVNHSKNETRFDRPFYDTVLGVRILIDGVLVPPCSPTPGPMTLRNTTATYTTHDAVCQWLYAPIVLCPPADHPLLLSTTIYWDVIDAFLHAAVCLDDGEHKVRVELVYGCRPEEDFVTDFIAEGEFQLMVTANGKRRCTDVLDTVERLRHNHVTRDDTEHYITLPGNVAASLGNCAQCRYPIRYACVYCGAGCCGRATCVRAAPKGGYPVPCRSHRPAKNQSK